MLEKITIVLQDMGATVADILLVMAPMGAGFALLSFFWACNPGKPWWRKRELATDFVYWLVIPLCARYLRLGLVIVAAAGLFGIVTVEGLVAFYADGHGPLGRLPFWAQVAVGVVANDFMLYWLHRAFHRPTLWRFHAIHHAPEELEWISAARFHPVNIMLGGIAADTVMLVAGIAPGALAALATLVLVHSGFVHANLNWTLGPFKYLLAGPVFHRWHHTLPERGGDKNFASTFPILDVLFGTFYMPEGKLPDAYGIADKTFPPGFGAQFLYPVRR